jgi:trimethylamine--corrinoid protein Co-methyltransferase
MFRQMSEDQLQAIHFASLDIMERTGMRFYDEEAIRLFKKARAYVDDGNRVHIPSHLVEWALGIAPKRVTLYDRDGKPTVFLQGYRSYFGPGSDCLNILDHRTGERRKPVLKDVVEGITLCDYLPNIDFTMSMFLPVDVPAALTDRYQMEVMLNYSKKPVVFVVNDLDGCVDAVKMAEIVAGGPLALEQKPHVACYIMPTTALRHNPETVQKLRYLADKRVPIIYVCHDMRGMTAPMTRAGALASMNAGQLGGLVLAQLTREGAPFIRSSLGGRSMDMKTMVALFGSELERSLGVDLAQSYHLPTFGKAGCTDSKVLDQQAGLEIGLTLIIDALNGANLVHDLGYLESGLTGSLEALAICDEAVRWIKEFMQPIEVNDETLALDVIDEVGVDGQFLETEHTLRHYREDWYPRLLNRQSYQAWEAGGKKTLQDKAKELVNNALGMRHSGLLPSNIAKRVKEVIHAAKV